MLPKNSNNTSNGGNENSTSPAVPTTPATTPSTLIRTIATPNNHQTSEPELKGWLMKWTNYIKGYQKRWFVLNNGFLYYSRNPMEISQSCRGTISLVSAMIHIEDSCNFVVGNGGAHTYHLKAANEVERQKWVSALELAKVRAIRQMDAEDDEMFDLSLVKDEVQSILKTLQGKLDNLSTSSDVVTKNEVNLYRILSDLEQTENPSEITAKVKAIQERATIFRITSCGLINACIDYLNYAQSHHKKLQKLLQHEHESRLKLEDLVEQLAKQHSNLEQRAIKQQKAVEHSALSRRDKNDDVTEDEEFFDAEENVAAEFVVTFPGKAHRIQSGAIYGESNERVRPEGASFEENTEKPKAEHQKLRRLVRNKSDLTTDGNSYDDDENFLYEDEEAYTEDDEGDIKIDVVTRKSSNANIRSTGSMKSSPSTAGFEDGSSSEERTATPSSDVSNGALRIRRKVIPYRPNHSLNLWSIMKNCIGKELTKIPMPVNFNEPLSMLQRMTEEFEYADILHKAAKLTDPVEQLAFVAAFCVTSYASTSARTSKPFNPLLGETFECDRSDDLGWKCISEQVSHHPPMLAQYCEGRGWVSWCEFSMMSKFRGKYLLVNPIDINHLEFPATGHHYTWHKVNTTVHNIIVGKLWVDNHGEMVITNHKTGDTCHMTFNAYSYFSREIPRKVTGVVLNKDKEIKWVLNGTWDSKMEISKVVSSTQKTKGAKPVIETGTPKVVWKRVFPPSESEKMYNMTLLAIQLNEPEEGLAPTDSRLRPDQRFMEEANWDEANRVKVALEDKQRATRRVREEEAEKAASEGRPYVPYEPLWFKKTTDPITGNPVHIYTQEYWQCKDRQDWSRCPDIYSY